MNLTNTQKNYISTALFVGSILLTRLSASMPPVIAHIFTIASTVILVYLTAPLLYDMYQRRRTVYQGNPIRNALILVALVLIVRWVEGHFLGSLYNMLVTLNLSAIAVCVYLYSHVYILPELKQILSKDRNQ